MRIADCEVTISSDEHSPFVCTTFPDGTYTMARPINEPWQQTRLHDLLHTALAALRKERWSPSLWNVAHKSNEYPPEVCAYEETDVLFLQQLIIDVMDGDRII